ncbi:hypothetical protein [Bacillus aerolatus]|uniref:hypothetical protein n=1 Tax=Bacillus aerolatus TaxID=2653354 RepID=UPI0017859F93|nr:hypothetical protein [Bacillus aerolatus]
MINEELEKRLEEVTYCLGKTLARLRVVEETLKKWEQQQLREHPQPSAQQSTIPC